MKENFKKYVCEFIGTFFLMFTVVSAVLLADSNVIAPLSIGFALMIMVYAGGHISGGHYNPAVSLAATIRGALDKKQLPLYWLSQLLGAVAAVFSIRIFTPFPPVTADGFALPAIIFGEFLFTFALCYVVLQVATSKKTEGNSYYGLAIGSTVLVGAFAVGGIFTPGAFNPAVALGLGLINGVTWLSVAVIIVTNLVAAVAAAYVYKYTDAE